MQSLIAVLNDRIAMPRDLFVAVRKILDLAEDAAIRFDRLTDGLHEFVERANFDPVVVRLKRGGKFDDRFRFQDKRGTDLAADHDDVMH